MTPVLRAIIVISMLAAWAALVYFGIQAARRKGVSPHWMWFGLHPVGAVIAFMVLRFGVQSRESEMLLQGRVVCTACHHAASEARPKRPSFWLGLPKYQCPSCKKTTLYPLPGGYLVANWIAFSLGVTGLLVELLRGQLAQFARSPAPVLLAAGVMLVWDAVVRRRVSEAERRFAETVQPSGLSPRPET